MAVEVTETIDEFGNSLILVTDPDKILMNYKVTKSNDGYCFFEVRVEKGNVPKELTSRFTSLRDAEKAVVSYVSKLPRSYTMKREKIKQAVEEQKKAKETA